MALKGNALIGQSGGPTMVINASLVGAIEAAEPRDEIEHFYGAVCGLTGVLNENMIDLFREDDDVIRALKDTPSAALGTCRLKPKQRDLERVMEVFKAHNIRYFFYTGGNDSQSACHLISELAKQSDWEMNIVGIPKTIDNDLVVTDNSPGFGSAARFAAAACQFVGKDAEAFRNAEVVEVMGRNAGWMTGATQVPRTEDWMAPHFALLPEVEINPDEFLADCKAAFDEYGYLVVAVSEGFSFADSEMTTTSDKLDEFGHARLGGVAQAMADLVEDTIGARCRWDRLGNMQRCFAYCVSDVDRDIAYAVGEAAVSKGVDGETDIMVTIEREQNEPFEFEVGTTSLMSVADEVKTVPLDWINERKTGITQQFVQYAEPLMRGSKAPVPAGLPSYPRLRRLFVEKKLAEYVREK